MKKHNQTGWKLLYLITALVCLTNLCLNIHDATSFSIDILPEGELRYVSESPQKTKQLAVYEVKNLYGSAVRAELRLPDGEATNIYWQTGISEQEFQWLNEDMIKVAGVTIDLSAGEYFDCRFDESILREGRVQGNKSRR